MNIIFSYSHDSDIKNAKEGHIFLGSGEDKDGNEVHVFLKRTENSGAALFNQDF